MDRDPRETETTFADRTASELPSRRFGLATSADDADLTETRELLTARAGRRVAPIPPEVVVEHVLRVTRDGDWRVRNAAMHALLRRFASARRDELKVVGRPKGSAYGTYRIRRKGRRDARPYTTVLRGVDPPEGSCDCPDFLKSSLGLCKHLVTALLDVYGRPKVLERARRAQRRASGSSGPTWHPVRPLLGTGDPLAAIE